MAQRKVDAVVDFVTGLQELKQQTKEDGKKLIEAIPLEVLADPVKLKEYLKELAEAVIKKHLISGNGKINGPASKLIKGYVRGMKR